MAASRALVMLMLALFCVHEMDAMVHAEWRMLPGFNILPDQLGQQVFALSHVPLFVFLFWALFWTAWARMAAVVFAIAMLAHATAHFLLRRAPDYTFEPPVETVAVYGAAVTGFLYLVLTMTRAKT